MSKWSKKREVYTMRFEVKLKGYWTNGEKFAEKPQQGKYNDSWEKINEGRKRKRILYKKEKGIWEIYKKKWFWEDGGGNIIRGKNRTQDKKVKKLKNNKIKVKFLT